MLKRALPNIYLTQCLLAKAFIHKSLWSPELPGVACDNCEALLCHWPKSCWAFSVLLPCSALLRWWWEHCPPSLCCGILVCAAQSSQLLPSFCYAIKRFTVMGCRAFYDHGWEGTGCLWASPPQIKANALKCIARVGLGGGLGRELNWANYVPRKALSLSVIKDKNTHLQLALLFY